MDRRAFMTKTLATTSLAFTPCAGLASAGRVANGYIRTNWGRDPFALGSYSYIAKDARQRDTRILAEPVEGRVFFAGEAAHPSYNSTVHAAYESGRIAAAQIGETDANHIVVLGAGISGMAAADALIRSGHRVTVLEARARIGGRIWSDDSMGAVLDLGASWIDGLTDNPLTKRAEALGLETRITDPDNYAVRDGDGRLMRDRDVPDWLTEVAEIEQSFGAQVPDINMRAYDNDRDYDGPVALFPGGYLQIFSGLATQAEIALNWDAKALRYGRDGVEIDNARGDSVAADAVVVTVPLGVLKANRIAFTPALPRDKTDAIARLGMGLLDKLYLRYDAVFWDQDADWILTPETGLPRGHFNQWLNLYPVTGEPILMAFNGADAAWRLADLPDGEILSQAQVTLARAYP